MEDIIKQIVQIDSAALSTRKDNEQLLKLRQEQYEKKMEDYKKEVFEKAELKANAIYEQILGESMKQFHLEEEKNKHRVLTMENHYVEVKDQLLKEVFMKLFGVEG